MKFKKLDAHSKAFFTVIACCALALGAIAWVGVANTMKSTDNKQEQTTVYDNSEQEVRKNVTNIEKTTNEKTTAKDEGTTVANETTAAAPDIKSYFVYPASEVVQKEYSNGNLVLSKTLGDYRSHNGTDFVVGENQTIKAINSGTVLSVDKDNLWGLVIEIDHGNGTVAKYCGLDKSNVAKGDIVQSGQEIGISGIIPIESADDPHLHLEIRVNGELVNPIQIMKKDSYQ